MAYIKAVTSSVAKMNMPLEWTTPTGFIVRQEIYQFTTRQVNTQLLGGTKFVVSTPSKDIDYHRMINSCAPNFVHSMDASHLTLATNYFADAGISSIAVIQDSFGTHAGATDLLRERLREELLELMADLTIPAVIITHDPGDVDVFAGSLILYDHGRARMVPNYADLRRGFDSPGRCLRHLQEQGPEQEPDLEPEQAPEQAQRLDICLGRSH